MYKKIYNRVVPLALRKKVYSLRHRNDAEKLRRKIIDYYQNGEGRLKHELYEQEINVLKKYKKIVFIPREFAFEYDKDNIYIEWDNNKKLYFALLDDKRLYFPKSHNKTIAQEAYMNRLIDQNPESPHLYWNDLWEKEMKRVGGCLIDIGASEGFIALKYIDNFEKVYIIEPEESWIPALKYTFEPYLEKVIIINKRIADRNSLGTINLDSLLKDIKEAPIWIKADIEGEESSMLKGASKLLSKENVFMSVCTYHNYDDAEKFDVLLRKMGFKTEYSDGSVLWGQINDIKPPFFRHGLVRAKKQIVKEE